METVLCYCIDYVIENLEVVSSVKGAPINNLSSDILNAIAENVSLKRLETMNSEMKLIKKLYMKKL